MSSSFTQATVCRLAAETIFVGLQLKLSKQHHAWNCVWTSKVSWG